MDLSQLNGPQAEAVRCTEGPLLVLAGAGSGKTRVIAHRVAYLLATKRVSPEHILAVTFTNKAAAEMRERIGRLAGRATRGLTVTTFHAFGATVLREEGKRLGLGRRFGIADGGDQLALVKKAMREVQIDGRAFDPKRVLALISKAKCAGRVPEPLPEGRGDDYDLCTAQVFPRYQRGLRAQGLCDFDDLILLPEKLFREHPEVLEAYRDRFRYILVDEWQDTSRSQFELLRLLTGVRQNLCVVGDDDQSIYAWRGAEVENILGFDRHFPAARQVTLEQNYRSTAPILACANAVIAQNPERRPKRLWCERPGGEAVKVVACPEEDEEARYISREIEALVRGGTRPGEVAVLYRTSAQSRPLEEALRGLGVPYQVSGGPEFFDRREVKDFLAYLRALANPDDELSLLRVLNVPPRGIGDATVERVSRFAAEHHLPLWEALRRAGEIAQVPASAARAIGAFVAMLEGFRTRLAQGPTPARPLLEQVGLREEIRRTAGSLEAASRRVAALEQALESVERHGGGGQRELLAYLRSLALDGRAEEGEANPEAVTLSTLHAAKGLEWPVVFLCGVEEDLLPHKGIQGEAQNLHEERRLAYVGITRARRRLALTFCQARRHRNKLVPRTPSRFLDDLPEEGTERVDLSAPPADASPEREQNFLADLRARLRAGGGGD